MSLSSQEIIFGPINLLVLEPDDDVYEEVIKPLMQETRPHVDPVMSTFGPSDSPPKKRLRVYFDYE
jgi:hypothetical protein